MKKLSFICLLISFNAFGLDVDIERYMGTWYEIARYENNFQRKCAATKVDYSLSRDKSFVTVKNTCKKLKNTKKQQVAKGRAFITDKETNSKLKVSFVPFFKRFGLFAGPYWILSTGINYDYAIVGHPEKKYLWILSRTPKLSKFQLLAALVTIEIAGYEVKKLKETPLWID